MPYSGADILTEVRQRFKDYDGSVEGVTDLQKAHDWVLQKARLYTDSSQDLTLVASQFEYAYNTSVIAIWQAVYFEDANDIGRPLLPLSISQLDQDIPTWRSNEDGLPIYVCDRGGSVVLVPAPDTATNGGFPKVTLYQTRAQTFSSATNLPSFVRQIDAWADYICHLHCKRYAIEQSGLWLETAVRSRQNLIEDMNAVVYYAKPTIKGKRIGSRRP
jgi:hypothetical protein